MGNKDSDSRKVLEQLHSLTRALDSAGDQLLQQELGLGFSQFKILSTLEKSPQSSQALIAAALNLTPPAVSRHVDSMLGKGLLVTKKNPKNRRQHLLSITAIGKETLQKSWRLFDSKFSNVMGSLSAAEQKQLISMLDQLLGCLNKNN